MKICSNCGYKIANEKALFCNACGESLTGQSEKFRKPGRDSGSHNHAKRRPEIEGIPLTLGNEGNAAPVRQDPPVVIGNGGGNGGNTKKIFAIMIAIFVSLSLLFFLVSIIGMSNSISEEPIPEYVNEEAVEDVSSTEGQGEHYVIIRFAGYRIDFYKLKMINDGFSIEQKRSSLKASDYQTDAIPTPENDLETIIQEEINHKVIRQVYFIAERSFRSDIIVQKYDSIIKKKNLGEIHFYSPRDYATNEDDMLIDYAKRHSSSRGNRREHMNN